MKLGRRSARFANTDRRVQISRSGIASHPVDDATLGSGQVRPVRLRRLLLASTAAPQRTLPLVVLPPILPPKPSPPALRPSRTFHPGAALPASSCAACLATSLPAAAYQIRLDRGARSGDGAGLPKALRCLLRQQGDAGTLYPPHPVSPRSLPISTGHCNESGSFSINRSVQKGGGGLVPFFISLVALISVTTERVVNHVFRQAPTICQHCFGYQSLTSKGKEIMSHDAGQPCSYRVACANLTCF